MRKEFIISTIILLLSSASFAQTKYQPKHLSFKVKRLTHKLQKYDELTGPRIGKGAHKSDQYKVFEKLKLKADENELYELTNHKSSIVRAYAFTGLTEIKSNRILDVISKNQNDTVIVNQQFGCIGSSNTVIGYMLTFAKKYIKDNNNVLTNTQNELLQKLIEEHSSWADRQRNAVDAIEN